MATLIRALCLALLCGTAHADFIASSGGNSVHLMMTPCALDIPIAKYMMAASATIDGTEWVACWAPLSKDLVGLVFSDGDTSAIPMREFRKLPEA